MKGANKLDSYQDQAEKQRQRIEKVEAPAKDLSSNELTPRSEMKNDHDTQTKVKVKNPLLTFLLIFFILLPLTVFSIYSYLNNKQKMSIPVEQDNSSSAFHPTQFKKL
jgi:hypothetical protein